MGKPPKRFPVPLIKPTARTRGGMILSSDGSIARPGGGPPSVEGGRAWTGRHRLSPAFAAPRAPKNMREGRFAMIGGRDWHKGPEPFPCGTVRPAIGPVEESVTE